MEKVDLEAQVAQEVAELKNAPVVSSAGHIGRCSFCGGVANRLTLIEVVNGLERYKGECCGG
jgi:hypothetical protein